MQKLNFCPNCGNKLVEGEPTVEIKQDALSAKPEKKTEETIVLVNPKTNILNAAIQLLFYFCIGMAVVSFFIAFKGFGLIKNREINPLTVWLTFGFSVAGAIGFGIFYYIKFMREK